MTTPTGPIVGTASVAITPSTATFVPQLQTGLQRAQRAVSDAADEMGDAIAREISRGVAQAQLALSTLGEGVGQRLNATVDASRSLHASLVGVGETATKAGAAFGAAGLAAGSLTAALGSLVATATELSGIVIALPAAVGAAALVMGTLKIATEGVGEAMGAALTGDTKAFSEAIGKLSPSAQAAANSVAQLQPQIDKLKKAVQERFFEQVAKDFGLFAVEATKLASSALPRISTELGKISGEFLRTARTGTFFPGLQAVVDQTVGGFQRWQGVMGLLADALGNLLRVGSEFTGDMIGGIGQLIARFSEWVNTAAQTGELKARLDGAIEAFAQLGRIIGNVGDIFGAFMSSANASGASLLGTLEDITGQFAAFLESDLGADTLTVLMTAAGTALDILGDAFTQLLPIIGQFSVLMGVTLTGALKDLAGPITALIDAFGTFADNATGGIATAIRTIADTIGLLMTALAPLLPVLGEIVGMLAEHFARILAAIAPLLVAFFDALVPILPEIQNLISVGLDFFVEAVTALVTAITPLIPQLLELATGVLQLLVQVFGEVVTAVGPLLPVLTDLATSVLTLLAEHVGTLIDAVIELAPVIVDLVTGGLELLADILPVVMEFIEPLIPVIKDIAKEFASALAPILPEIADAFKEIFEALKPVLPQLLELAGDVLVSAAELFTALVKAVLPLLPPLIQIGAEILKILIPAFDSILTAITPLLPVISELAVTLLRDALLPVIQALLPVLPILIDAFVQMLPSLVAILPPLVDIVVALTPVIVLAADLAALITSVLMPAIELLVIILATRLTFAFTVVGAAVDAFVTVVKIGWDAIVTAIQVAWLIIKGIFDVIVSILQGDFGEAWNRLKDLISDVWDKIKGFITGALSDILSFFLEWIPKLFSAAFDGLAAIAGVFSDKAAEFVKSIGDGIIDIVQWFKSLPSLVEDAFRDFGTWLFNKGKDIIEGLLNGIKDKAQGIKDFINKWVVDPIKDAIGGVGGFLFGSPSKWMEQRGKWLVEGMAVGIQEETAVAVGATSDLVSAVKSPVQSAAADSAPDISGILGTASVAAPGVPAAGTDRMMSIAFGQGSVMVSFEGVVPSEADALRTGRAVGQGIVDVIAERDARLAVRVL